MSAVQCARLVSTSVAVLVAVPTEFIEHRRWSRSPGTFDLHPVERWLILRSWARGGHRADA